MKKFINNQWILGIGTTVIGGVLLAFVLNQIESVNLLNVLSAIVKFIVHAIIAFLNFELKVWWVLVAIILFISILIVIAKNDKSKSKKETPGFMNYTKDSVLGYSWEWEYAKLYDSKYTIKNLHPVCSKCGMILKQSGSYGTKMECLRCGTTRDWKDSYLTDAQMLIEDNIKNEYLKKQ